MLSKAERDYVIDLLERGEELPEDFKYKLFPVTHREYELAYAGKMRREDLLADEDGSCPCRWTGYTRRRRRPPGRTAGAT